MIGLIMEGLELDRVSDTKEVFIRGIVSVQKLAL